MATYANGPEGSRAVAVDLFSSRRPLNSTAAWPSASDRLIRSVSQVATIAAQLRDLVEAAEIALHDLDEKAAELTAALDQLGREAPP